MVSKLPNVSWPKGTFMEIVKGRQQQWFYVTEPRDTTWAAAPEFTSGAPMRLTSWLEKGLDWASSDELTVLQTRIKSMLDKNIKLVNVIQVMLFRRILPCQSRTFHLWEFDPAEHQTLQSFMFPSIRISGRCSLSPANHGRARPRTVGINYPILQAR